MLKTTYFHPNIAPSNPISGEKFHQWNFQTGSSVDVSFTVGAAVGVLVGIAVGASVMVGVGVGVGVGVAVDVAVGVRVGVGVEVGIAVVLIVTIGATYTGVGVAIGATFVLPPHIIIEAYEQDEPVQPSLQITRPFPCAPATQLTPL